MGHNMTNLRKPQIVWTFWKYHHIRIDLYFVMPHIHIDMNKLSHLTVQCIVYPHGQNVLRNSTDDEYISSIVYDSENERLYEMWHGARYWASNHSGFQTAIPETVYIVERMKIETGFVYKYQVCIMFILCLIYYTSDNVLKYTNE